MADPHICIYIYMESNTCNVPVRLHVVRPAVIGFTQNRLPGCLISYEVLFIHKVLFIHRI